MVDGIDLSEMHPSREKSKLLFFSFIYKASIKPVKLQSLRLHSFGMFFEKLQGIKPIRPLKQWKVEKYSKVSKKYKVWMCEGPTYFQVMAGVSFLGISASGMLLPVKPFGPILLTI